MSSTFSATTSQPRSLLSIARLNIARSRVLPSNCSLLRIDQMCFGLSGDLASVSFPLFQAKRSVVVVGNCVCGSCMAVLLCSPKRTFDSEDCYRARRARRRRRRSARNRRSTLPGLTQLSEKRLHVLRQRLRLLHRGEMAAAREDGPAAQIHERLLGDRARRAHHFLREGGVADRGRRRPLDRHRPTPPLAEII